MHLDPTAKTVLWALFDLSRRGAATDARCLARHTGEPLALAVAGLARLEAAGLADHGRARLTMRGLVVASCIDAARRAQRRQRATATRPARRSSARAA